MLYFSSSLLCETRRGTTASLLQTFAVYTCSETCRLSPSQPLGSSTARARSASPSAWGSDSVPQRSCWQRCPFILPLLFVVFHRWLCVFVNDTNIHCPGFESPTNPSDFIPAPHPFSWKELLVNILQNCLQKSPKNFVSKKSRKW